MRGSVVPLAVCFLLSATPLSSGSLELHNQKAETVRPAQNYTGEPSCGLCILTRSLADSLKVNIESVAILWAEPAPTVRSLRNSDGAHALDATTTSWMKAVDARRCPARPKDSEV